MENPRVLTQDEMKKLYYNQDTYILTFEGIPFKCKDLSGPEFAALADECMEGNMSDVKKMKMNRTKYMKAMIDRCILEPKIDFSKLNTKAMTWFVSEFDKRMGVTEEAVRNLE